jgi:hypothetical protein
MLSIYKDTDRYKLFDRTEQSSKIDQFLNLLKEPAVQTFLKTVIEATIATSDLKILKRLSKVEAMLGLLDEDLVEEEDRDSSLPARLKILEGEVNTLNTSIEPLYTPPMNLTTKTQKRACALIGKLRKNKKRFLTSSEIVHFLKHEISEELRITEDVCNPREVKKEVLEKAIELFPDIQLSKKQYGRREVRIYVS